MKRLFAFLISGYWNEPEPKRHEHEWETIGITRVHERLDDGTLTELPVKAIYILHCKTCGDVKRVTCA
jgi:hypothetical protein